MDPVVIRESYDILYPLIQGFRTERQDCSIVYSTHIFKIKVLDSIYCMKSIHRTGREADFIREVQMLSQCAHPNIIGLASIVEALESDKIEGMLTHFVSNARVLRNVERLSIAECKKWTTQISEAVRYLHGKGLIWGDVKASNVLIDENGNAMAIDFGGGFTDDERNQGTVRGDL